VSSSIASATPPGQETNSQLTLILPISNDGITSSYIEVMNPKPMCGTVAAVLQAAHVTVNIHKFSLRALVIGNYFY
jgi:hypothetical protein